MAAEEFDKEGFVSVVIAIVSAIIVFAIIKAVRSGGSHRSYAKTQARAVANSIKPTGKVDAKKRFVAIDFETANERYYSACSLGLVVFEGYVPVLRKTWLLNPHTKFDSANISIHNITPSMVEDAPTFDKVWPEILPYLESCRIVGYSDFDAKVLKSLVTHWKINLSGKLNIDYFDVCQCSRDTILGLANYKLPTVCQYLGIRGLDHHNACSDAEACGKIYCWLARNGGKQITASQGDSASYAQQDYIRNLGGVVPPTLTRAQASLMIDQLIQERARKQEEECEARRFARERKREEERNAKQAAKQATKLFEQRQKEETALRLLADEMSDPKYKERKSRSKRIRDLKEFQVMVNNVIADSVIEPAEAIRIKSWLLDHRVLDGDFKIMLKLIDDALADGTIDDVETQSLYEGMLDCITTLRKRQST